MTMTHSLRNGLLILAALGLAGCSTLQTNRKSSGSTSLGGYRPKDVDLPLIVTNVPGEYFATKGKGEKKGLVHALNKVEIGELQELALKIPAGSQYPSSAVVQVTADIVDLEPYGGSYRTHTIASVNSNLLDTTDPDYFDGDETDTVTKSGWAHVLFKFDPDKVENVDPGPQIVMFWVNATTGTSPNKHTYYGAFPYMLIP